MNLVELREIVDVVESGVTMLALIVGGIWTWLLFVRQRINLPRLITSIEPHALRLDHGWLIHVNIAIRNTGTVLARLARAELRLRQMVPLPDEFESLTRRGCDPVEQGRSEILWPMLARREWSYGERECEIEPGESDALVADFFAPASVESVQLYLFIANEAKKPQNIGWTSTVVHELGDHGGTAPRKTGEDASPGQARGKDGRRPLGGRQKQQRP